MNHPKVLRFIKRLSLPPHVSFKLKKFEMYEEPNKGCLILYHAIRDTCGQTKYDIAKSIKEHGFYSSLYGNKGVGVYLANHGRYSLRWAHPPLLICQVEPNDGYVKRFRSEIYSPGIHNSEYVVTCSSKVKAIGLIDYDVDKSFDDVERPQKHQWTSYVIHGFSGCKACDAEVKRCDCQLPIDLNDII